MQTQVTAPNECGAGGGVGQHARQLRTVYGLRTAPSVRYPKRQNPARSHVDRRHDHSTVVSAPVTANMPTSAVTNADTQQQKNNIRHTYTHTRKET